LFSGSSPLALLRAQARRRSPQSSLAGLLAIAAAAITAVITSLRPDDRAQRHWSSANAFARLVNKTYMAFFFSSPALKNHKSADRAGADEQSGAHKARSLLPTPSMPEEAAAPPLEETVPPSATPEDQLEPEETVPPSATPGDQLERIQDDFHGLDMAAPQLPDRFRKKGAEALAEHTGWYPPQYEDFVDWRERVLKRKTRWWSSGPDNRSGGSG
jgi:hypothetical protein